MQKNKVFASRFLESMNKNHPNQNNWDWQPASNNAYEIYASGAPTSTQQSTYADGRDNRSDSDRPNEGLMAI
ncbi:hypothetical protein [Campylobacter sp. US33a]|uniref:hypothetical protein n=1 Tax=Campylobacter sp. US33a TaxID=2498120 RepID=UPI0010681455|nr:hypothetical protein [Campylobacter sp. US33a]TEY01569.1 hypothetical protein ELQ16_07310 [Campylobacter sp. US33a]